MRGVLAFTLAAVAVPAMAASSVTMHRDPGCPCCEKWAAQVQRELGRTVKVLDDANRAATMKRLQVPASLAGCHTIVIDGLVIEGHVPVADIERALAQRSPQVKGLAVAGMPLGSPGMETSGTPERYTVYAFGSGPPRVFARH